MWIPKELGWMADRLKNGHRVNRITVRDLLWMFNAERRGFNKVQDIRAALESLGLETDPDFAFQWIDGDIKICLKNNTGAGCGSLPVEDPDPTDEDTEMDLIESDGTPLPEIVISSGGEGVVETKLSEPPDPTFRIGSFPAANKPLVTVGQDDELRVAVTKMLQFDYSQLPIMQGEREVKGIISWRSIGARLAVSGEQDKVRCCREDAQVVDGSGTLFEAIPTIVKHGYVLVRHQHDRRITGIITASDLSLQFQQLAEPFLLLREIELHIRQLLQGKISIEDLETLGSPEMNASTPKSVSDLTFGGYVRLLQQPLIWEKLAIKNVDKSSMTSQLEKVRLIRNDVMHFDQDPMTKDQLEVLKNTTKFLQQLYELLL